MEVHHELMKITPDPELDAYVHEVYQEFAARQEKVACYVKQNVDLRFKTIRK